MQHNTGIFALTAFYFALFSFYFVVIHHRKLRKNLLAASFGSHMCRPLGPVPLPFRADESVSPCQCPHRSCGTERGSALHRGGHKTEMGAMEILFLCVYLCFTVIVFFRCVGTIQQHLAVARCLEFQSQLLFLPSEILYLTSIFFPN